MSFVHDMVQYVHRPAVLSLIPKGQRVSQIAALNENGFVYVKMINSEGNKKRGVNANDFQSFIIELATKVPRGSVFILDNAKIHHAY